MYPHTRVSLLAFLSIAVGAVSCASGLPPYDPANYAPLPPLTGPLCDPSVTQGEGVEAVACAERLDVFVKRGLAASVLVFPGLYSPGDKPPQGLQAGSGVVIDADGTVLTARHVLNGGSYAMVAVRVVGGLRGYPQFEDAGSVMMRVVAQDEQRDLAVLVPLTPTRFKVFIAPGAERANAGQRLWHFGRVSLAVAGPSCEVDPSTLAAETGATKMAAIPGLAALQVKAQKGDSGAAVVSVDGTLAGILVGNAEGDLRGKAVQLGLFVPMDEILIGLPGIVASAPSARSE